VTNQGAVALTDVTVSDPVVPACDSTGVTLAAGASASTYCTLPSISVAVVNVATASFAGELAPFPTSRAEVMDTPAPITAASTLAAPITAASTAPVVPVITSGSIYAPVTLAAAPVVTG
jgi:hypothetical protein